LGKTTLRVRVSVMTRTATDHFVVEYEEVSTQELFAKEGRLSGGGAGSFLLPWVFVIIPLLTIGFGGYLLLAGIRNSVEDCDEPLADLLIAMGSFLVAPFLLGCLFVPAFLSGTGSDTEDLLIKGGMTLAVLDMLGFLVSLAIATSLYSSATHCAAGLLSETQGLLIGAWSAAAAALIFTAVIVTKRTTEGSTSHK